MNGTEDHPSGVPVRVFEAVTGSDGRLQRGEVVRLVNAYVSGQRVDGVAVDRADVLALVRYYASG